MHHSVSDLLKYIYDMAINIYYRMRRKLSKQLGRSLTLMMVLTFTKLALTRLMVSNSQHM